MIIRPIAYFFQSRLKLLLNTKETIKIFPKSQYVFAKSGHTTGYTLSASNRINILCAEFQ